VTVIARGRLRHREELRRVAKLRRRAAEAMASGKSVEEVADQLGLSADAARGLIRSAGARVS
jgi:DNA-binding CsgD family transcriptional regulator